MSESDGRSSVPIYYTNQIRMKVSPFGFILGIDVKGSADQVEQLCELHLSPHHAKALAQVLTKNVEAFEEKVGSLPDLLPTLVPRPEGGEKS